VVFLEYLAKALFRHDAEVHRLQPWDLQGMENNSGQWNSSLPSMTAQLSGSFRKFQQS
jgi:hypothetical protein